MIQEQIKRFNECAFRPYTDIFGLDENICEMKELYKEVTGQEFYKFGYPINYMYEEQLTFYAEQLKAVLSAILTLREATHGKHGVSEKST